MHASRTTLFRVILLGLAAASALWASTGPRIKFDKPDFDFGNIYQEENVTHEFAFKNSGDAPLKLGKISSSCGCTAAYPSGQEIAPGKTGSIRITFSAGRMRNKVSKHIYIDTNDTTNPRATLTFTGFIKRAVDIAPFGIFLGTVKVGQSVEREVTIRPVDVKSFRILEVRSNHQGVHVSDPEPINDEQGGYRIKIRFGPLDAPTRINTTVIVRTDLKHAKDLRITVYGRVGQQTPPPAPSAR
jgi:hypothetical protein